MADPGSIHPLDSGGDAVPGSRGRRRIGNIRSRHYRYTAVASALTVLISYSSILPMLRGDLQAYLGISNNQFGQLFSAGPLMGILSALFGGALLDWIGPTRMMRYALRGLAVSAALFGCAGAHWLCFLLAVCLSSLFAGAFSMAVSLYLARLFPRDQRRVLAFSLAIGSAGGFLLPLLAEGLLWLAHSGSFSFGQMLHTSFLLMAALLALASLGYKSARLPRTHRRPTGGPWRPALPPLSLAWLGSLIALHVAADVCLYLWMAPFLESGSFAAHPVLPGLVLSAFSLAYLIARVLLAALPERWGRRAFLVIPGCAGGTLLILGLLSRSYWLTVGGYVFGAFLWSAEYPALLSAVLDRGRHCVGRTLAFSGVLAALLSAAFIAAVGGLAERLGNEQMWIAMLLPACVFPAIGIGGALWLILFGERSRRACSTPAVLALRTVERRAKGITPAELRR